MLVRLRAMAARAGVFLDLDGTLCEIVAHPDLARLAPGAREAIASLVARYGVVAVVTGRRAEEAGGLLGVPGVRIEGLYGMEDEPLPPDAAVAARAREAASVVPEAWVEDKGATISVHYRGAPDPASARAALAEALAAVAVGAGMTLVEGKMVLELAPTDRPMKGGVVERIVGELGLEGALFAGDDVADLEAFAALDRLAAGGLSTVKVAVRGPETPDGLMAAADIVVDGPGGLVELLLELA